MYHYLYVAAIFFGLQTVHAQSTEKSLTEASLDYFRNSLVDDTPFSSMEPKLRKLFACQSREVFKAGLDPKAIHAYEMYMRGGKVQGSMIEKVGSVFNGAESLCKAEVK